MALLHVFESISDDYNFWFSKNSMPVFNRFRVIGRKSFFSLAVFTHQGGSPRTWSIKVGIKKLESLGYSTA